MARQDLNEALAQTSFLFGGNAASIEDLYARFQENPSSVDAEWQAFFEALKDDGRIVEKNARGASWKRPNWPIAANGELVAALNGNWASIEAAIGGKVKAKAQAKGVEISQEQILQATRDSVRALMLIRAYRVRGHLHADLDPLELAVRGDHEELHPSHYGFTDADLDRPIFLETCSVSRSPPSARSSRSWSAPIARRSASSSCTSPIRASQRQRRRVPPMQ